jgi:hypothetical protein
MSSAALNRDPANRSASSTKNVEFPLLLPGVRVNTSPTDYRPIEQLRLMRYNGRNWEEIDADDRPRRNPLHQGKGSDKRRAGSTEAE